MKTQISTLIFSAAFALLQGCDDNNHGTDSGVPMLTSNFSQELPGIWKADSALTLKAGFLTVPAGITMHVQFLGGGTFKSYLEASFLQNPVEGHLFEEIGTWVVKSSDTAVVRPTACLAADTLPDPGYNGIVLPFKAVESKFVANELKPSVCPDSILVTVHPTHDTLRLVVPVTVPTQGKSSWALLFHKQP